MSLEIIIVTTQCHHHLNPQKPLETEYRIIIDDDNHNDGSNSNASTEGKRINDHKNDHFMLR